MKKILFVSNTANFYKFNAIYINWCINNGYLVDYCAPNDELIKNCHEHIILPIPRSPFSHKVFYCIKKLRILLNKNNYDLIHCHTPMGSVIARLAAKKLYKNNSIKIIYTAHGFHFFKGAKIINWLIYYPVEKILSKYVDILITINKEDYDLAQKKFHMKQLVLMNGVGCDLSKYSPVNYPKKCSLRKELNLPEDAFIILYTAEFIKRKNHKYIFDIYPLLSNRIPKLYIILAGKGKLLEYYKNKCKKYNINNIFFTGYTNNISDYCKCSDLLFSPSFQEGLPISMIEALATGLPIVASKIRGHTDIITNNNGILFDLKERKTQVVDKIVDLYNKETLREKMRENNIERAKIYGEIPALETVSNLYKSLL